MTHGRFRGRQGEVRKVAAHTAGFAELLRAGEQLGWAGDAQVSARCFWRRRAFKREGGRPSARGRASVEGQVEPRVKEGRILSLLDLGLPPPGRGTWAPGGWLRILGAEQCSPCPSPQSDPVGTGTPAPRVPACRWGAALSPEDPNSRAGSRSHSRWWEARTAGRHGPPGGERPCLGAGRAVAHGEARPAGSLGSWEETATPGGAWEGSLLRDAAPHPAAAWAVSPGGRAERVSFGSRG